MVAWEVENIIHFAAGDLCIGGFVHFGFHDRDGRQYALEHQRHFLGPVGKNDRLEWTVARQPVWPGVANIRADLEFPMYIDTFADCRLVVSSLGSKCLYRIDIARMESELFVDGAAHGLKDVGNCVVDDEDCVWVNEVEGCRLWRFDPAGGPLLTLGNGTPGFNPGAADFDEARFNWIYDIRKGPDGNIYVLDSKNFAVRMVDLKTQRVRTLAGTGKGGYDGDGGDARAATFGSDPGARFDGPYSLSIDERGNLFIGDRYNHVVRMIHRGTGIITTIAGCFSNTTDEKNLPGEKDPLKLNLPKISSMDYYGGRLFVPTDLAEDSGDLIVLRRGDEGGAI